MNSKGTVIYVGGFELPDKNAASHRVLSNAKLLKELGYRVVFIGINKELDQKSNIQDTRIVVQGFESWSLPYPTKNIEWVNYLSNIDDIKTVFQLYNDVKLVIAYNYQSIALIRLKKYCRKKECKIIADATEWYSTKGTNMLFKLIKGIDSFLRMRLIQKWLDGLIVISSYLERYYNQYSPTVRIPPLVDIEEDKWKQKLIENKRRKLIFVFAGTLGRNKDNVDKIIEYFYEIKNNKSYILQVLGISRKEYIDKYPHHVKKINELNANVKFIGKKTHIESVRILKAADFCIFIREDNFSTKAGFPTKFVESFTSGTPVITSNSSDLSEYLVDGLNGFILDIEDKATGISKLNEIINMDKSRISDMKSNIDIKKFDYKNYLSVVENFLEELNIV